jgi:DnaJ-related protein SCJ1
MLRIRKIVTSTCHVCRAQKLIDSVDSLSIFIEKGAPDGHEVTYKDSADEFLNFRAGVVIFKVQQLSHSKFQRVGNDLKVRVNISLREALLGFSREITHLDGHVVNFEREGKTTKPGLLERFKGEGMPVFEHYGDFGDLMVNYIVDMPQVLSNE